MRWSQSSANNQAIRKRSAAHTNKLVGKGVHVFPRAQHAMKQDCCGWRCPGSCPSLAPSHLQFSGNLALDTVWLTLQLKCLRPEWQVRLSSVRVDQGATSMPLGQGAVISKLFQV